MGIEMFKMNKLHDKVHHIETCGISWPNTKCHMSIQ